MSSPPNETHVSLNIKANESVDDRPTLRGVGGRYLKGTKPGPGFNKSYRRNLARVATEATLAAGKTLDERLAMVFDALFVRATADKKDSVAAAKLLFDTLGELAPKVIDVGLTLSIEEKAARIVEIMDRARVRRVTEQLLGDLDE